MENLFSTLNLAYDLKTAAKLFEYEVVVHLIYRGENAIKNGENYVNGRNLWKKTFISALKYYDKKNLIIFKLFFLRKI